MDIAKAFSVLLMKSAESDDPETAKAVIEIARQSVDALINISRCLSLLAAAHQQGIPDSEHSCDRCGTAWTGDIMACPTCQDEETGGPMEVHAHVVCETVENLAMGGFRIRCACGAMGEIPYRDDLPVWYS